jgi:hypothetical protein
MTEDYFDPTDPIGQEQADLGDLDTRPFSADRVQTEEGPFLVSLLTDLAMIESTLYRVLSRISRGDLQAMRHTLIAVITEASRSLDAMKTVVGTRLGRIGGGEHVT